MLLVLVDVGIAITFAALVAAPILAYRGRALPHLARRGEGRAAYVIAAVPMVLALVLGIWLLTGWFSGWAAVRPGLVALALLLLLLVGSDTDLLGRLSRGKPLEPPPQATERLRVAQRSLGGLAIVVFGAVAIPLSVRPIEESWACAGIELALPAQAPTEIGEPLPLEIALDGQPEPGAILVQLAAYDLEAAADSRHDPRSRQQLIDFGFLAGARRAWETPDGATITADVFEFRDPGGALRYQRAVNRYACSTANPFSAPRDGVGLQIERQEGWIEDQISWVSGARRYRVSVFSTTPPLDHQRVLAVARNVAAHSGH